MAANLDLRKQILTEDEIDDLIYFARTGDIDEVTTSVREISSRTGLSPPDLLLKAKDEGGQTPLHMAVGNGHLGTDHNVSLHAIRASTNKPKNPRITCSDRVLQQP